MELGLLVTGRGLDTPREPAEPAEEYAAPALHVLGSVTALTAQWCVFDKTLGKPDYVLHIAVPIANCSS
jgi:hypothetical protein